MATYTERTYRRGRREYGLTAEQALEYARNSLVVGVNGFLVTQEIDTEGEVADGRYIELVLLLVDTETEEVVEALGGVQIDFEVSDHGNINFDENDPYYVFIVAQMIQEHEASIGLGDDDLAMAGAL